MTTDASPPKITPPASSLREVADHLHSAAIHLLRHVRRQDVDSGLSAARLSALSVIVFGGPIRLGDLAEVEQVSPPSMTRLARALEDDGLIERVPDPDDARGTWAQTTAKGRRILEEGRERRLAELEHHLSRLTPAELEGLGSSSQLLIKLFAGRKE